MIPHHTRNPLAEGFLRATPPLPSPSLPAVPGDLLHRFHLPVHFAGLCNSDSLAHHLNCTEEPGCPGRRRAHRLRRSGEGYPAQE